MELLKSKSNQRRRINYGEAGDGCSFCLLLVVCMYDEKVVVLDNCDR